MSATPASEMPSSTGPWSSAGPTLPRAEMLARMRAADPTADGLFVTGVVTTGIYCLPSCPARKPNPENVVFFGDGAGARAAGLRPCKRCHPDDYEAGIDRERERFASAQRALAADPASVRDVGAFADRVGVSPSTLHALAVRVTGRPPGELIHAARIEAAKRILAAGAETATGTAFAVGYESVSAFYVRFRRATGTTPGAFARSASGRRRPA